MANNNLHIDLNENRGGFAVPENYFDESREHLFAKINKGGLITPEGYFEKSRKQILEAINSEKQKPQLIKLKVSRWWYAAASVCLAGLISILLLRPETPQRADLNAVSNEEIVNYFLTSESINDIPAAELYTNDLASATGEEEELVNLLDEELLLNEL